MSDLPLFLFPLLEDLASLRSSSSRRLRALTSLDSLLATLCIPSTSPADHQTPYQGGNHLNGQQEKRARELREEAAQREQERVRILGVFVGLQEGIEGNVVTTLLPLLARTLPILHDQLVRKESEQATLPTLSELVLILNLLQGMCLLHPRSRDFVGRRSSMEIILDLLLLTRHLPLPLPPTPSSANSSTPSAESVPLASTLLDTLSCTLADSPHLTRIFEDCGGLEIVMRVLKSKGGRKDVRMKALEFLCFYLLDEEDSDSSTLPPVPTTPSSQHHPSPTFSDNKALPSSTPSRRTPRDPSSSSSSSQQLDHRESSPFARVSSEMQGLGFSFSSANASSSSLDPLANYSQSRYASSTSSVANTPTSSSNHLEPPSQLRAGPPRTPSAASKHRNHGLGVSSTPSSQPMIQSRSTPSSPNPQSRLSASTSVARAASQSHHLSSPSSLSPILPSSLEAKLESFVPQTPQKPSRLSSSSTQHPPTDDTSSDPLAKLRRREAEEQERADGGVARTPSRYRIQETDDETDGGLSETPIATARRARIESEDAAKAGGREKKEGIERDSSFVGRSGLGIGALGSPSSRKASSSVRKPSSGLMLPPAVIPSRSSRPTPSTTSSMPSSSSSSSSTATPKPSPSTRDRPGFIARSSSVSSNSSAHSSSSSSSSTRSVSTTTKRSASSSTSASTSQSSHSPSSTGSRGAKSRHSTAAAAASVVAVKPKARVPTPSFSLQPPPPTLPHHHHQHHQQQHQPTSSSPQFQSQVQTTTAAPATPRSRPSTSSSTPISARTPSSSSSASSHLHPPSPLLPLPHPSSPSSRHTRQRTSPTKSSVFALQQERPHTAAAAAAAAGREGRKTRTVEEKKALLGVWMGNVESLASVLGGGAGGKGGR